MALYLKSLDAEQPLRPTVPAGWQIEPDYLESYQQWLKNPSPEAASLLVQKLQPILDSAITSYAGQSSPTIRSRARKMAIDALKTYDPKRGTIRTHLLSQLRGLRRTAAAEQSLIQLPEQRALDWQILQEAERALTLELGHEPSTAQLADYTGLPIKRITQLRKIQLPVPFGASEGVAPSGESSLDPSQDLAARLPWIEDAQFSAWVDYVYQDLSPRDQVILDYMLGLHGKPKLSTGEIAKRLRITPSAVSQRTKYLQQLLSARDVFQPF